MTDKQKIAAFDILLNKISGNKSKEKDPVEKAKDIIKQSETKKNESETPEVSDFEKYKLEKEAEIKGLNDKIELSNKTLNNLVNVFEKGGTTKEVEETTKQEEADEVEFLNQLKNIQ